jgi:hypothetical protein
MLVPCILGGFITIVKGTLEARKALNPLNDFDFVSDVELVSALDSSPMTVIS